MNKEIRAILESDLLERYLLGEVSAQEQAQVLELRRSSPDIREALDELENTLEQVALDEQFAPPPGLRDKVLRQDYSSAPQASTFRLNPAMLGYAATLLLLTGGVWFWQQQRINGLATQVDAYTEQIATIEADCQKVNLQFALMNAPDTRPLVLSGTAYAPSSSVLVYWNATEQACLLRVLDLPEIPSDKTYQLWADIEGEMKSLGTFDHRSASDALLQMAYLEEAESLNVTVEPAGGSDHATASTLSAVVMI